MGSKYYLFDEYKLDFVWLLSTFSSSPAKVPPNFRFLAKSEDNDLLSMGHSLIVCRFLISGNQVFAPLDWLFSVGIYLPICQGFTTFQEENSLKSFYKFIMLTL